MFEGHFGLRENPFVAAHQSRYIYPSPEHQEALAHLRYGIENREPFVLITGEVGTGKTTALFDALSEWEGRAVVGLITNSSLTRAELLEEIALRLGMAVPQSSTKPQIMVALERHLLAIHEEGLRAILLLDEAQNLERELLEEIRLLSNLETAGEKLVQIFLVGQPELEGRLGRPELRQLRQRIAVHYRLRPLGAADAERYIHHRITVAGGHALSIFPPDACAEVHRLTNGIPREMNHLCSQSMVCAFVEGAPTVTREHVRTAAHELEFQSVLGKERRTRNIPPLVERRQGPTIPGAAPPPEREMRVAAPSPVEPPPLAQTAPARMPAAAPAPAPAAPADTRASAPPRHEPPSSAPSEDRPPVWRPDATGEDDLEEEAAGPPRWNPAEFEHRTDPADELFEDSENEAEDDVMLEDGMDDDAAFDDLEEPGEFEDDEDGDEGPETGPPRLMASPAAPGETSEAPGLHGDDASQVERSVATPDAAAAGPTTPLEPGDPSPHGAVGEEWESLFETLTTEAGDTTQAEPLPEPEQKAPVEPRAHDPRPPQHAGPPRVEELEFDLEDVDEPVATGASESPERPQAPSTEPVIEPAGSTSAFEAALRRAREFYPESDEASDSARPAPRPAPPGAPAMTRRPQPAGAATRSLESLPPRLREKMAMRDDVPRESNPLPGRIMIAAALLLIVIAGAILTQRLLFTGTPASNAGSEAPAGAPTTGDTQAVATPVAPEPESGEAAESSRPATPPASAGDAAPAATPAPARQPPAEPAAPAPTFALAVGTYLNELRAQNEQARLSTGTSYQVTIAPVRDGSVAMHRVTLGTFPTRTAAERAASDLISRGVVEEARIIAIRDR